MITDIQSALACSLLLLELAGIKVCQDAISPSDQSIDTNLKKISQTYGVKLKHKKLKYANLSPKDLPIAFLSKDGTYRILAKMDCTQCLIQNPNKSHSELWSIEQLINHWIGKVINVSSGLEYFLV